MGRYVINARRWVRANLVDTMGEGYIRNARAKGLSAVQARAPFVTLLNRVMDVTYAHLDPRVRFA